MTTRKIPPRPPCCTVPGCATRKLAVDEDICLHHKAQWDTWGTFDCRVPGCVNEARYSTVGLCCTHYNRLRRHGTLEDHRDFAFLPLAPLVAKVKQLGGFRACLRPVGDDVLRQRWQKWYDRVLLAGRVTMESADEFSVTVLGIHPSLVWGESWWLHEAENHEEAG